MLRLAMTFCAPPPCSWLTRSNTFLLFKISQGFYCTGFCIGPPQVLYHILKQCCYSHLYPFALHAQDCSAFQSMLCIRRRYPLQAQGTRKHYLLSGPGCLIRCWRQRAIRTSLLPSTHSTFPHAEKEAQKYPNLPGGRLYCSVSRQK